MVRLTMTDRPLLMCMFAVFVVLNGVGASNFCQEVVEPFGYGCAEYAVQTSDGFVLLMHRLSRINGLIWSVRGSSPVVRTPPASASAPVQGDRIVSKYPDAGSPSPVQGGPIVSQYPEASSPSPVQGGPVVSQYLEASSPSSVQGGPIVSEYSEAIKDSTEYRAVSTSAMANVTTSSVPAPEVFGNRNVTSATHSNSTNATHRGTRSHPPSPKRSSPAGAPITSTISSNSTSSNSSLEQPVVAAGPAPTATQNASSTSATHRQRQSTTGNGSTSDYTANPLAGKGSPVLLMHQEFFNGDIWFQFADTTENRSSSLLPLMLLNDGFDVWIGHERATYWSHGHVQLKSTAREYWNWTWDEHVQYDLSTQLLFISTETNQPVHFIGSSQAATVGVAAATGHEVAQMIRSLTLIGPTAYRGYSNSLLLEAWAYDFGLTIDSEYYVTGYQNGAFNFSTEFPRTGPFSAQGLSNTAIALISGPNCCLGSAAPVQFVNGWDGTTSFKNLLHWQQGIRTNNFAHFDYGSPARNMQAYGRAAPPAYNVGQIPRRMPILIFGGGRDWFAPPQGIRLLLSQFQQQATLVNLTNYAHYDLLFSVRRDTDVYLPILQYLEGPLFQ